MKRLFRTVVSVVVCALALMPTAWGRDNRFRMGHPDNDNPSFTIASASPVVSTFYITRLPNGAILLGWVKWTPNVKTLVPTKASGPSAASVRNGAAR